jgi:hypothetical protein
VLYQINASRTVTALGSVSASAIPATFSYNTAIGHQVFVTAGRKGYIYDTVDQTFAQITDVDFPTNVGQGLFFDGYFAALDLDTGKFVLSDLFDGLNWNGLDFGLESQFPDKVISFTRTHDNLWLYGSQNTAPWYDSGNPSFPFQPVQGGLIEHGIAAPFSAVELDNTVWWLGRDAQGSGVVWRANGYTPVRVSTHAVEYELGKLQDYSNAVAYGYQEEGHSFYVLYVPGLPTTWVYDVSTDEWHERGHWDVQRNDYVPHVAVNHCYAFGKHLVGDRQSGAVYEQRMPLYESATGLWRFADDRLVLT